MVSINLLYMCYCAESKTAKLEPLKPLSIRMNVNFQTPIDPSIYENITSQISPSRAAAVALGL